MKFDNIFKGASLLKIVNGLIIVALVAVVIYDVKVTSELRGGATEVEVANDRHKRSLPDNRGDLGGLPAGNTEIKLGGAIYTRWGRTTCGEEDAELVYDGISGGAYFDHFGGGSNYVCLPMDPQWKNFNPAVQNFGIIYGAEYRTQTKNFPFPNEETLMNHNAPCAVCRSKARSTVMMVPARYECYPGWTEEYSGYLVSGHHAHKGRTEYVCMDETPEADPSGYRTENGVLFYPVEGSCGALPCPPYAAGRELTCVVCTK